MMRNLATIQTISAIYPIPDADQIETAQVLGWQVVVRKAEEYRVGDSCVYIEIDSVLPDSNPAFEFMRERKFRVKTIKLRKQISQGLIFPLSILPTNKKYKVGQDVTDILGIKKYDPEAVAENMVCKRDKNLSWLGKILYRFSWYRRWFTKRGGMEKFPRGVHKTDEIRIQSCPHVLDIHRGENFYITEKLDGQSVTYYIDKKEFGVCSRNFILTVPKSGSYWGIATKYNMKELLQKAQKDYGINLAIQGENIGSGVQGNKYNLTGYEFYLFNVWDITHQRFFTLEEQIDFCLKYGLKHVPIYDFRSPLDITIPDLLKIADRKSMVNPQTPIEGIVVRECGRTTFDRVSFKVINNEFLLKYGE